MKDCAVTFRSVTPAQQGENVLKKAGIECSLQRTPRWMEEQGCGYCLRISSRETAGASLLLRRAGIAWKRIYRIREDGRVEVLSL